MSWWMWGLVANLGIQVVETINRSSTRGYLGTIPFTLPFIILAQTGLYYAWNKAPGLLVAWAAFTVGNTLLRLAVTTHMVKEPPSLWQVLGVTLILGGGAILTFMKG